MAGTLPVTVWEKAAEIEGWLYEGEAKLLWDLCEAPWCEVGSFQGRSSVVLAEKATPGWCIDSFIDVEELSGDEARIALRENVAPYDVTILDGDFRHFASEVPDLAFLHLDADHSYEATVQAFSLYAHKVRSGGHLVIHDAWWAHWSRFPEGKLHSAHPGVTPFVVELLDDPEWEHVKDVERSAAFRKR